MLATKIVQVFLRYVNFLANPILKRIRTLGKGEGKIKRSKFVKVRDAEETLPSYHPLGLGSCPLLSPASDRACERGRDSSCHEYSQVESHSELSLLALPLVSDP